MDAIRTLPFEQLLRDYPLKKRVFILYLIVGLVALLPLRFYVSAQRWWLLPLTALPIYGLGITRTLQSTRIAAKIIKKQESASDGYAPVIEQWRTLTRYIWRNAAPLTLLKLELAIGFAQWLHNVPPWVVSCDTFWLNGNICYYSDHYYLYVSPFFGLIVLGGLILAVFTYLESAFLAAIALCIGQYRERFWPRLRVILLIRLLLLAVSLLTWVGLWRLQDALGLVRIRDYCFWVIPGCERDSLFFDSAGNPQYFDLTDPSNIGNGSSLSNLAELNIVGVFTEHQRLAAWTSLDGGVLMAANMMRPGFGLFYLLYTNLSFVLFSVAMYLLGIGLFLAATKNFAAQRLGRSAVKFAESPL
jgi:hypothetical protein